MHLRSTRQQPRTRSVGPRNQRIIFDRHSGLAIRATKLASETLALEYGHSFACPWLSIVAACWPESPSTLFSFWIRCTRRGESPRYMGFGGTGHQVHHAGCIPRTWLTSDGAADGGA